MSLDAIEFRKALGPRLRQGHNFKIFASFGKKEHEILDYSHPNYPTDTRGDATWKNTHPMQSLARDCFERLGLIKMTTEIYPTSELREITSIYGVKYDNHFETEWPDWFTNATKSCSFAPDTNILLSRTLSTIIGRNIPRLLVNRITIPRLVILELENLANANSQKRVSKGECFMAYSEIRFLKRNYNAKIGLTLPSEELISFISPKRGFFADSFIRQEVRRMSEPLPSTRHLFIARDMVNALTANAEGMDAIYISPKDPDQTILKSLSYESICNFIVEIATTKHEITIQWDEGEPNKHKIIGVWSGKRWYDYFRRRIRVFPLN